MFKLFYIFLLCITLGCSLDSRSKHDEINLTRENLEFEQFKKQENLISIFNNKDSLSKIDTETLSVKFDEMKSGNFTYLTLFFRKTTVLKLTKKYWDPYNAKYAIHEIYFDNSNFACADKWNSIGFDTIFRFFNKNEVIKVLKSNPGKTEYKFEKKYYDYELSRFSFETVNDLKYFPEFDFNTSNSFDCIYPVLSNNQEVIMYTKPDKNSKTLTVISEIDEKLFYFQAKFVKKQTKKELWFKVKSPKGYIGWVYAGDDSIQLIETE
jgi:hypothetical protein